MTFDCYCALCDLYFPSHEARKEHVAGSLLHPHCEKCKIRFLNESSLRNHYIYSQRHHYCVSCDVQFSTASGLRMHTSTHEDDSDDADDYSFSSSYPSFTKGQEDLLDCLVYRVEDAEDEGVDSSDDDDSWELYVECMDEVDLGDFEDNHIVEEEDDEYGVFVDKLPCAFCDSPPQATITTPYYGHTFCAPWHSTFKTHVHSVTRVDL